MIKIKEKDFEKICDNLVIYWNSIRGGTFVNGLLGAMQTLANYSDHPYLKTALMKHEYLSKRSPEDKERDVLTWENYLKSPCKVLWIDDGGFPMCKYHKKSVSCFLADILFLRKELDESKCPDGRRLKKSLKN